MDKHLLEVDIMKEVLKLQKSNSPVVVSVTEESEYVDYERLLLRKVIYKASSEGDIPRNLVNVDEASKDVLWGILEKYEGNLRRGGITNTVVSMHVSPVKRAIGNNQNKEHGVTLVVMDIINKKVNIVPDVFSSYSMTSKSMMITNVLGDIVAKYRVSEHEAFFILLMSNGLQGNYLTDEDGWEELLSTVDSRAERVSPEGRYATYCMEYGQGNKAVAKRFMVRVHNNHKLRNLKRYGDSWGGMANSLHVSFSSYSYSLELSKSSIVGYYIQDSQIVAKIDPYLVDMDYKDNNLKVSYKVIPHIESSRWYGGSKVVSADVKLSVDLGDLSQVLDAERVISKVTYSKGAYFRNMEATSIVIVNDITRQYPNMPNKLVDVIENHARTIVQRAVNRSGVQLMNKVKYDIGTINRGEVYQVSVDRLRDLSLIANFLASTINTIGYNNLIEESESRIQYLSSELIRNQSENGILEVNKIGIGSINYLRSVGFKYRDDLNPLPTKGNSKVISNNMQNSSIVWYLLNSSDISTDVTNKELAIRIMYHTYERVIGNLSTRDNLEKRLVAPKKSNSILMGATSIDKSVRANYGTSSEDLSKYLEDSLEISEHVYEVLKPYWEENKELIGEGAKRLLLDSGWESIIGYRPKKVINKVDSKGIWDVISTSSGVSKLIYHMSNPATSLMGLSQPMGNFSAVDYLNALDKSDLSDILNSVGHSMSSTDMSNLYNIFTKLINEVGLSPIKASETVTYILEDTVSRQRIRSVSNAIVVYRDYLSAYISLEEMEFRSFDRFEHVPFSLMLAHDIFTYESEHLKSVADEDKFVSKYEYLTDIKRLWKPVKIQEEEYVMVQPKNIEDLKAEGRSLSHCVGGYASRIIRGECLILFLRKKGTSDKSFITVEVLTRKDAEGNIKYSLGHIQGSNALNNRAPNMVFRSAIKEKVDFIRYHEEYLEDQEERRKMEELLKEEAI